MNLLSNVRVCALMALSMMAFGEAQAVCNAGGVTCMAGPGAGEKQCSRTIMCNATASGGGVVSQSTSNGAVQCGGGGNFDGLTMFTSTLVATATTGTSFTTVHQCSWTWSTFTMSGSMSFGFVSITDADGLPVELMDFGIYDEE